MTDDELSTPTADPVPRLLGHTEEYEIVHALARRFAGITSTLLEAARGIDSMEGATREQSLAQIRERIRHIARLILGPNAEGNHVGQPRGGDQKGYLKALRKWWSQR